MQLQHGAQDAPRAARHRQDAVPEVVQRHVPEQRDGDGPHHGAVRADPAQLVERLLDQPVDEDDPGQRPGVQGQPQRPVQPRPQEQGGAEGGDGGEGAQAEQHVGEAQHTALRARQHTAAADDGAEIARGPVVRVAQHPPAVGGQLEGGQPADQSGEGDDQGRRPARPQGGAPRPRGAPGLLGSPLGRHARLPVRRPGLFPPGLFPPGRCRGTPPRGAGTAAPLRLR